MDEDRLNHTLAVARKMKDIANEYKLSKDDINNCFLIGYNHDIGYEFSNNEKNHNKIGGKILKASGFEFWKEVYYHGEIEPNYNSIYLDILNMADMQIDKYGNDVGYDKRLEDIKNRYGVDSEIYNKCVELVLKLKK